LEAQPVNFLAFLLNNKGKGGLRQSLLTEGLVLDVEVGILESLTDRCLLYIELRLSESGFEHWETAIELVLAYISGLRTAEKADLEQAWDHYKASRLADFDYAIDFSAMYIAMLIASNMLVFPPEQYLAGFDLQEKVDLDSFRGELAAMTLENCVGVFMSSKWSKGDMFLGKKLKFSESEHFYGILYDLFAFPNRVKGDFELNPFLPAVLLSSHAPITLQPCPNCTSLPSLLFFSKSLQVWHSFDASYNKPFAYVSVFMSCPTSIVGQVLTRMYISQLQYLYQEKSALWDAGVSVVVERSEGSRTGRGLTITVSSPNALLVNAIKAALAVIPPSSNSYFALIYEDLRTKLDSKGSEMPIQRAMAVLKRLIQAGAYLDSELLATLEDITLGEVEDFYREVVHSGNTVSLISGNIDSDTAVEIANIMKDWSSNRHPNADSGLNHYKISGSYAYQEVLTPSSTHAIANWYNLGASSNSTLAAANVLEKFVKYGAFDELRNKQQLGYVAGAEVNSVLGNVYLIVLIQGAYQPPHVMDVRIGEFLRDFEEKLENLTDTDISNAKDSVINSLLVGSETMQEWHYRTFTAILKGEDEGLNLYLIPYIQQVTKAELKHLIALARTSNSDISVQVYKADSKPSPAVNRTQVTGLDYFA
jgi:secreted Zn-dependent insulinase-like peptidase